MSKAPTYLLRVEKGALVPADAGVHAALRAKGYNRGDELVATLKKARNPKFHRLAHVFGRLIAENIEAFEGMDSHKVLKRIQIEAGIGCDEIPLQIAGIGPCVYKVPRSLSFDSMDEGEFRHVYEAMARHIVKTYWKGLTVDQIDAMVTAMPEAA